MQIFTACRDLVEHSKFIMCLVEMFISWYTNKDFLDVDPGLGLVVEFSITVQRFGFSSSPGPEALNFSSPCLHECYTNPLHAFT
jgi:hypothetical protein